MKSPASTQAAPALTRGLRVLELLAVDGQQSLERLARKTGWPKSSVLRYLSALAQINAARQDETSRKWEALQQLQPIVRGESALLNATRTRLATLADKVGHCVELFRFSEGSATLVDRAEPEASEVFIKARIGFVRDLRELEAVSILCYAIGGIALPKEGVWRTESGEPVHVDMEEFAYTIGDAKAQRYACDHEFNANGVRRFAIPLVEEGKLRGIVSVAQRQTPRAPQESVAIEKALIAF